MNSNLIKGEEREIFLYNFLIKIIYLGINEPGIKILNR